MTAQPKKRRGPLSDAKLIERALERPLTEQIQRTANAVFARIELLSTQGKQIPIALLGAARLFAEWHTDFLSIEGDVNDDPGSSSTTEASPAPARPSEEESGG